MLAPVRDRLTVFRWIAADLPPARAGFGSCGVFSGARVGICPMYQYRIRVHYSTMTIEQPRFPSPEDERRASLFYQVLRALADLDQSTSWESGTEGVDKPAEAGSNVDKRSR